MISPLTRSWAEINLSNLSGNYETLAGVLPADCSVMGIVKANAYGHGAVRVAAQLTEIGCPLLAVACMAEAYELRQAGIKTPILILGPEPASSAPLAAELDAAMTFGSLESAKYASSLLNGKSLKIHIKLDTGMCRTGFDASDNKSISDAARLFSLPGIEPIGVFTHFAVSDDATDPFTRVQFGRFLSAVAAIEAETGRHFEIKHCANSAAVLHYKKEMSLDMVRPGISLYGMYSGAQSGGVELLPVMTLFSRVSAVYWRKADETVSYGRTHTLDKDTRIAVLPVGYGDGLPRILSNALEVSFDGIMAKQLGRICMDMLMVDITNFPNIKEGDTAVIFGSGGPCADELARAASTISYELFCGITERIPRIYI